MNIYWREIKANRKALFFWCLGVIALVVSGMAKYEGAAASGQSMNTIVEKMPKIIKAVTGIGSLDLSTIGGYYGVIYAYIVLMTTIYGAILGGTILAKERSDKTAEFLFVKPVSRQRVITMKVLAAMTNFVIFTAITTVSSIMSVDYLNKGTSLTTSIMTLMVGMFLLQVFFFSLGVACSTWSKQNKAGIIGATTLLFIFYLLSIFVDMSDKLEWLKYITPFKYFDASLILVGEGLDVSYVFICLIITIGLWVSTYILFSKKDVV